MQKLLSRASILETEGAFVVFTDNKVPISDILRWASINNPMQMVDANQRIPVNCLLTGYNFNDWDPSIALTLGTYTHSGGEISERYGIRDVRNPSNVQIVYVPQKVEAVAAA